MLRTKLTTALGIKHPVILAGMDEAAGPELVAAVSNAGGMGVVGGALYTPKQLKELLDGVKVQSRSGCGRIELINDRLDCIVRICHLE
jgi:NAD(P)H-dependent flavin oxidoreductase YrpB (nitropropane dioxygenase family)